MMTMREAKRIALKNIVDGVGRWLDNGVDVEYWEQHPETGDDLSTGEIGQIKKAARDLLDVMRRRAERLKSVRSGR